MRNVFLENRWHQKMNYLTIPHMIVSQKMSHIKNNTQFIKLTHLTGCWRRKWLHFSRCCCLLLRRKTYLRQNLFDDGQKRPSFWLIFLPVVISLRSLLERIHGKTEMTSRENSKNLLRRRTSSGAPVFRFGQLLLCSRPMKTGGAIISTNEKRKWR